jgi:hypothetical protein
VRRAVPQHGDAKQRLHEPLDRTHSRFAEYEPHMPGRPPAGPRAPSLEAAGLLEEEPFRRGPARRDPRHHAPAPCAGA